MGCESGWHTSTYSDNYDFVAVEVDLWPYRHQHEYGWTGIRTRFEQVTIHLLRRLVATTSSPSFYRRVLRCNRRGIGLRIRACR